jgi:enoyl-CoA hydratase
MGGTQRLTRAIGKSRAMELCLTGDFMGAEEACTRGLVSKVVKIEETVPEALTIARKICSKSKISTMMAKECVNEAFETSLHQGLLYEKRMFHALFATAD